MPHVPAAPSHAPQELPTDPHAAPESNDEERERWLAETLARAPSLSDTAMARIARILAAILTRERTDPDDD